VTTLAIHQIMMSLVHGIIVSSTLILHVKTKLAGLNCSGKLKLVRSLFELNPKYIHIMDIQDRTPFFVSIEMGHLACAKWFVDVSGLHDVSKEDWMGRTPFFAACENE
jgi:hypothetical protein